MHDTFQNIDIISIYLLNRNKLINYEVQVGMLTAVDKFLSPTFFSVIFAQDLKSVQARHGFSPPPPSRCERTGI